MNKKQLTVILMFTAILFLATTMVLAKDVPFPKKVFTENGNIYYSSDGKKKIQLTKNGKVRAPVISPDGTKVAFIRKSKDEAYLAVGSREDYLQSGPDAILADQVWIIDIDGKNEIMLVKDRQPNGARGDDITRELEKTIAHIDDDSLHFSPDSKTVYFISSAWVTTGALHSVNIDGSNEHFIEGANTLNKIIDKGDYKGDLIISQHRYFLGGGSYDWYYVFTLDGKEVGPLGDDLDTVDWNMLYFESKKE